MSGPQFTRTPCDHPNAYMLVPGVPEDDAWACPDCGADDGSAGRGWVVLPVKVPMNTQVMHDRPDGKGCGYMPISEGASLVCTKCGWTGTAEPDSGWLAYDQPCNCHGDGECDHCVPTPHATTGEPDYTRGRRTAPIVTPCTNAMATEYGEYHDDTCDCQGEGYVDTGERCSWTLAPVAKPFELTWTGKPYVSVNADGAAIIGMDAALGPIPISLDVSEGDVVAFPDHERPETATVNSLTPDERQRVRDEAIIRATLARTHFRPRPHNLGWTDETFTEIIEAADEDLPS